MSSGGALLIVGTPIGNLSDISSRGVEALTRADVIACEDTRRTGMLLKHLGVPKRPFVVVNEHTEFDASTKLVDRILAGETVALVSDAGMPLVSDPGERLVASALEANCVVDVMPGPTAISAALVLSGLSSRRFVFEGFLPRKGSERATVLLDIAQSPRTVVLYESPRRVTKTLADLAAACGGDRQVAVARELTKLHQEVWRGSLAAGSAYFADAAAKGEFVVVVEAISTDTAEVTDDDISAQLRIHLDDGLSVRDATAEVVGQLGVAKRRVYAIATDLRSQ